VSAPLTIHLSLYWPCPYTGPLFTCPYTGDQRFLHALATLQWPLAADAAGNSQLTVSHC